jgi:HlyD family secretion protein
MNNKEKTYKEIELRSEEVQEIMGKIPSWVIRWGLTVFLILILILLIGSYFFKFPDTITADMTLTSRQPVTQIVARSSGKINELLVSEGDIVQEGTLLAILDNSASTADILEIKKELTRYFYNPDSISISQIIRQELSLGDVQSSYSSFLSNVHEYINFQTLTYYPQKIEQIQKQIQLYGGYYYRLQQQVNAIQLQYKIAKQQYARDSLLFIHGLLSASDYDTAHATLIQNLSSLESLLASLENVKIQIAAQESTLLDLQLQHTEKENVLLQSYHRVAEQLQSAINAWELDYCLISPINGKVSFNTFWNINQYVSSGEKVFTIVPEKTDELIGKAYLPIQRSGKAKTGQRVIIRFKNYPDQEFGLVEGKVSAISLTPMEGNYAIEITLPNGLVTNYNIMLPIAQEMTATAEIVTEELRLIERLIMPVKSIVKERF